MLKYRSVITLTIWDMFSLMQSHISKGNFAMMWLVALLSACLESIKED